MVGFIYGSICFSLTGLISVREKKLRKNFGKRTTQNKELTKWQTNRGLK